MKKLYILLFLLFFGCKPYTKIVEVPVERVRVEKKNRLRVDSFYVKDTMWHKRDTVFLQSYRYRQKLLYDTIWHTDTIEKVIKIRSPTVVAKPNLMSRINGMIHDAMSIGFWVLLIWFLWIRKR